MNRTKLISMVFIFTALYFIMCYETGFTEENDGRFLLKVREFAQSVDAGKFDTEMDSSYEFKTIELNKENVALVLIDVWKYHPNDGWLARAQKNVTQKVIPLLHLARENKLKIIHIPHEYDMYGIHPDVRPPDNKPPMVLRSQTCPKGADVPDIFADTNEIAIKDYDAEILAWCLRNHGINTLIYAGYASNWCLMHRDAGIINMKRHDFDVIFVRDCSIALETPETLEGEMAHKAVTMIIEVQYGSSTTLVDLQDALSH